jgi:hypothetical protein
MFRYILVALSALVLVTVTLIPDDAYARRSVAAEAAFTAAACAPEVTAVAACMPDGLLGHRIR